MSDALQVTVDDIDDLGFGELLDACDAAGVDVRHVKAASGNKLLRLMVAIAWVKLRRDDPKLTIEDVGRLKLEVGEQRRPNPLRPVPVRRSRRSPSPPATRRSKSA